MRYSILKAGKATRATRERRGDYDSIFIDMLRQEGQQWESHDVENGEFPSSFEGYDGFVITGSPASANDDEPWVHGLLEAIRKIHQRGTPMLGICFGCQAVAQAMGGKVEINPQGWDIGLSEVTLNETGRAFPSLENAPNPFRILEVHQDIVTRVPEGALVLGSSPRTPVEIFTLGENVLCIQGHPEMDHEMVRELIVKRHERGMLDEERAQEGLASLAGAPHEAFLQGWLRAFMREGRLSRAA